jgi:inosose dehydratase
MNWVPAPSTSQGVLTQYKSEDDGRMRVVADFDGDGSVDFPAIFRILAEADYRGWLVVEAEEDPVKVPALPKAKSARAYVRTHAGV